MNNNNIIKELVMLLNEQLDKITIEEDKKNIIYLCNSLERIQNELPTLEELDKIQKIEIDLEVKYEELYEIGIYFDKIYINIKNDIHKNYVKKLREENKRNRERNKV